MKKIITEIKKIGKGDRYYLYLDDELFGVYEAEILAKSGIKTGESYDEDFFEELKIKNGDYACFNRGLGVLEKTMKTEKMLKDFLLSKGYPIQCVTRAIEKIKSYGYINDEAFCESFISSYSQSKSTRKLKYELLSKGVGEEIIEQKLRDMVDEQTEFENCFVIAQKYMKNKEFDLKTKQKCFNHLASKGFDYGTISSVWQKLEEENK